MSLTIAELYEIAGHASSRLPASRLVDHIKLLEEHPTTKESFEKDQLVVALWDAPIADIDDATTITGNDYRVSLVHGDDDIVVSGEFNDKLGDPIGRRIRYNAMPIEGFDPRRIFMLANFTLKDLEPGMLLRPTHRFGSYYLGDRHVVPENTYEVVNPGSSHDVSVLGTTVIVRGLFSSGEHEAKYGMGKPDHLKKFPDDLAIPIQCAFTIEKPTLPPEQQAMLDMFKSLAETSEGKAVLTDLLSGLVKEKS